MNPDVLIVSFPKSGRTWLRVMLSRYRQRLLAAADFDLTLHRLPGTRGVTYDFTHAGADPKFGPLRLRKHVLRHSERRCLSALPTWLHGVRRIEIPKGAGRYLFLVRDPRDVLVSFYHQARSRNRFWTGDLDGFSRHRLVGIERIVMLMNHLVGRAELLGARFFHYEDLRANPAVTFRDLLIAAGDRLEPEFLHEAIEFSSFENMRRMEASGQYGKRLSRWRLDDPNSAKTRQGKVGGYTQELSLRTVSWIEDYLHEHLDAWYARYLYRT